MMISTLMYAVLAASGLIGSAIAVEDLKKAFVGPADYDARIKPAA